MIPPTHLHKILPTFLPLTAFLPLTTNAQTTPGPSFPCHKFWPTITPGDSHTLNAPCFNYPGYPTTIGAIPVHVIHTADFTPLISPDLSTLLLDALSRSLSTYGTLTPTTPEIVLILTNISHPQYTLATNSPEYPPSPCQIIAYRKWQDGVFPTSTNPGPAKQQLAHELYHCIQQVHLIDIQTPYNKWLREGSAMYFSNVVYPAVDVEWPDSRGYNPDVPLYLHNGAGHASSGDRRSSYATGLWFQALEGSRGMVWLNEFVLGAGASKGLMTAGEERARLSSVGGMDGDLYKFAGDFTLARAFPMALVGIRDTNGMFIRPISGGGIKGVVLKMDKEGKEGRVDISTVPFTVSEFVFKVDGGQIVMISTTGGTVSRGKKVGWRLEGQTVWSELPEGGGGAAGSKGFIVTPCEESVKVYVLFSSTGDVEVDRTTIKVEQFYKDESCKCKDGRKRKGGVKDGCKEKGDKEHEDEDDGEDGEKTGSCKASDIATNQCILGTKRWSLDLPSTKKLVDEKLREAVSGVSGIVVDVTGSGEFIVGGEDGRNVTMTYKGLSVHTVVTVEGMEIATTTTIDGVVDANMFTTSSRGEGLGSVCLVMYAGHGSVVGSSPLVGEVLRFDLAAGDWISQDWDVRYTCGGGKFTIHGVLDGVTKFGPFVYNAVA